MQVSHVHISILIVQMIFPTEINLIKYIKPDVISIY